MHQHTTWTTATQVTLHCLTGCAIGEVLGMVIGAVGNLTNGVTVALSIVLAFAFGYALTIRGLRVMQVRWKAALATAFFADTVSIAVMELIDNSVMLLIPGAMTATLQDWLFWTSLITSLILAFLITTPVNKWLMSRGKGHAVVHAHH